MCALSTPTRVAGALCHWRRCGRLADIDPQERSLRAVVVRLSRSAHLERSVRRRGVCAATGDAPYDQRTRVTETPRRYAPGVCWSDARSLGRTSTARCVVRERAVGTPECRLERAPHAVCAMRRGVVEHRRDIRRILPPWNRCQTQPSLIVNHLRCVRPDSCRRPSRKRGSQSWAQAPSRSAGPASAGSERSEEPCTAPSTAPDSNA
jgi:hypothetical protein